MENSDTVKNSKFWKDLWGLLAFQKKQIYILLVLIVFYEGLKMIGPYLLKLIIDQLTQFRPEAIQKILMLILMMFGVEQFNSLSSYFRDRKIFRILIDTEYQLPLIAQSKLVFLSLDYHERENTGNKLSKIERGISKISELLANLSWEVIPTMIQLVATIIVLFVTDWRFGAVFSFFAPIFIVTTYLMNRKLRPLRKQRQLDYEEASGKLGQAIININSVKSFVQEKRETDEYGVIKEAIRFKEIKEWFTMLNANWTRNLTIDFGRLSILLLGVYFVWNQAVTIGTLIFVYTLSEKSFFSLYRLTRFFDKMAEGAVAVERFMGIVNEESEIVNKTDGNRPKKIDGQIEFDNVDFAYSESGGKALENINLRINSGCITALVGPSGGGKTTLARMIYRHYDPARGIVRLDGRDLRDYDLYAFRRFIAIVPQEVEIFDMSVRDNIAYAKPKASMREVQAAARIANAEEFIDKLPKRYDTQVGERGIKLSGGQRQRVGIARAILANPRVLIFDEATSNLDSYSERLIQDAMDKISKGRTTIIIAHRLSTIRKADKIVVLQNGKVVEEGNHLELSRAKGGLYARLLDLQKMGDVE